MTAYRTTAFYDETAIDTARVFRSDWYGVDEKRMVEYMAAQLVMHDYKSSIVFEIVEGRLPNYRHDHDALVLWLRRLYSTYHFFAAHFKGESKTVHVDATARRLHISSREVWAGLRDAELFGIGALVKEVA